MQITAFFPGTSNWQKINIKLSKTKTKSKVAQQLKVFIKALHFIQSDAECLYKAATKVVENYALLFYSFHVKNFSYTSMLKRLTFYSVLNIVSERLGKWLKNDSNCPESVDFPTNCK